MTKEKPKNLTLEEISQIVEQATDDRIHNLAVGVCRRIAKGRFLVSGGRIATRVMWHGDLTFNEKIYLQRALQQYGFCEIEFEITIGFFFTGYWVIMRVDKERFRNDTTAIARFAEGVDKTIDDMLEQFESNKLMIGNEKS